MRSSIRVCSVTFASEQGEVRRIQHHDKKHEKPNGVETEEPVMIALYSSQSAKIPFGAKSFKVAGMIDGIPVCPALPAAFSHTDNEKRPKAHRLWWDTPYIEIYLGTDQEWLKSWPSGARYDVRCLDGGAWDRPTSWGMFGTLPEAIACAKAGPTWRQQ